MTSAERVQPKDLLTATTEKFHQYLEEVIAPGEEVKAETLPPLKLTYPEAAVLLGIKAADLRELTGRRMEMWFKDDEVIIYFSPDLNLIREAYQIGTELLQLSVGGRAERRLAEMRAEEREILAKLKEKVPGFEDLLISVEAGATPGQPEETVIQHLRLVSWWGILQTAGKTGDLIPPRLIFTQPE